MKINYDPETDILYIRLADGIEYDVIEAGEAEIHARRIYARGYPKCSDTA